MLPLIPAALALAELAGNLAPTIAGWLGGPKAKDVAEKVVDVAQVVTGVKDTATSIAMIQADPQKALDFQHKLLESQIEMARLANEVPLAEIQAGVDGLRVVNETMQAESKSEKWWQNGWRPYIGFVFGTYIASLFVLPIFHVTPIRLSVDETMAVLAVLGIASWGRSRSKTGG